MKRTTAILLVLLLILTGCAPQQTDNNQVSTENNETVVKVDNILDRINFTESELEYLEKIKSDGELKVASRQVETVFKDIDGERTGFNYNTIKYFTDSLGVELSLMPVENIEMFFRKDGVFDEAVRDRADIVYKPDLFYEVDVYVDTLTQLPWREKLMNFIGFTPIRELVIHNKDTNIRSVYDLSGKTVAVQKVSSYMSTLIEIENSHGIEIEYVFTDTILEALQSVNNGTADFTIMDSNRAFLEAKVLDHVEVGIPLTDVKYVGWAVAKDNPVLQSLMTKYMDALIDEGIINDLWLTDYDISFYEYYTLILKDASVLEAMNLSSEELEYINVLREKGSLNVAMQPNVVGYIFDGDEPTGYNYLLARDLANILGVELRVTLVDQFTKYFWKDGSTPEEIKTDPEYYYVPDLFDEVDIYTDNLTHLAWRKQILNQIEGVPVSSIIVQHIDSNIKSIQDLDGLVAAISKDTSYELVLNQLIETYGLNVDVIEVYDEYQSYTAVDNGNADFTIIDSDIAFLFLQDYDNLVISLQAADVAFIGWAVKKEDKVLASIVTKYIEAMKENGKFDEYWEETYGVSYAEYMRLLID